MITVKPTPDSQRRFKEAWDSIVGILNLGHRELEKIADAGRRGIALNFSTESAGGEPWHPLAPMTVSQRRSLGFAGEHPVLQRTTSLKRSLVDPNHPLNVTEVSTHGFYSQLTRILIELGSADERFPILHAGGISDEGYYIPPRPMTVLGDEAIRQLETSIIFVIEERWKRLGHR
jgi:hypothetical protein